MDDLKALAIVIGNLGGVGFLAWALLRLHEKALAAFRDEMSAERATHSAVVAAERAERLAYQNTDRGEHLARHDKVITAIDQARDDARAHHSTTVAALARIENEVRDLRQSLEHS